MRKLLTAALVLLMILVCGTALAQSLTLDRIHASCSVDDNYIVLTPDNLDRHEEWIAAHDTTAEAILNDFTERGVLAQAWTAEGDARLEITAVQDSWASKYYDLDQQSTSVRGEYRKAFLNGSFFGEGSGYKAQETEWKNTKQYGRVLMIKYRQTIGEEVVRGYQRAMVRNGYDIIIDYRVFSRTLRSVDLNALNALMGTWQFTATEEKATVTTADVEFTQLPPTETNTGKFNVEGTCSPNIKLIAVLLRMSSSEPTVLETTASSKGKFAFENIKLPSEGIWLMTVTAMNDENELGEYVLNTITYQESLMPVNFIDAKVDMTSDLPQEIPGDTLVISGTTLGYVTIQCIVDGPITYSKTIKTNNSGKFSFEFDTTKNGEYSIVLAMDKKKANSRRFAITATRTVTRKDLIARAKKTAVKPAYSTLLEKINKYTGKIMVYPAYITDIQQAGSEWIITAALKRAKDGTCSRFVVIITDEDPGISVDEQYTMYGTCTGLYTVENEEKNTDYPCFELITFEK